MGWRDYVPGNIEVWQIFIGCFMPGFIAIKVYGLYRAIDARDFSKKWYDAVGFGVFFFVLYQTVGRPLIDVVMRCLSYDLVAMVVQLVFFVLMPAILAYVMAHKGYSFREKNKDMLMPQETAWDYIFSKGESYYVTIHLKDGEKIYGEYSGKSFSSAYPQTAQIYIEKQILLDKEGNPGRVNNSAGIWISETDISWIDFRIYNSGGDNL